MIDDSDYDDDMIMLIMRMVQQKEATRTMMSIMTTLTNALN